MANASITTEQRERLEKFVAGIGHNQGPALDAHVESISKHVAQLHGLRAEATRIRVIRT